MMKKAAYHNYFLIACCLLLVFAFNAYHVPEAQSAGSEPARIVYLGGFPVGVVLKPRGVIVVGPATVETELGSMVPKLPVYGGDIIETIDGKQINYASDIRSVLDETIGMSVNLGVRRGTALLSIPLGLIKEDMTGEKRLGLQIRENIAGVGTVTYVKEDGSFGCLGHPILLENGSMVPCVTGEAFDCKILGYNKGVRGRAGELKGAFTGNSPRGTLCKNCQSGVFGKFNDFKGEKQIEVASRKSVTAGKATILSTIGDSVEEYSIEIVKASAQNSVSDKSMIIRITDKRLISSTGGIVQGMSGSPIIQNGKLVGAVTHVFVSDPTKGYGIYADWMMQ